MFDPVAEEALRVVPAWDGPRFTLLIAPFRGRPGVFGQESVLYLA